MRRKRYRALRRDGSGEIERAVLVPVGEDVLDAHRDQDAGGAFDPTDAVGQRYLNLQTREVVRTTEDQREAIRAVLGR